MQRSSPASPITLAAYSLLPKSTFQRSPNRHLRRKIQHFSGEDTDKHTAKSTPKHAIWSDKFKFSGERPSFQTQSASALCMERWTPHFSNLVYRQSARRWRTYRVTVGCHYFLPGLRLSSQPQGITALWLVLSLPPTYRVIESTWL